MSYSNPAGKKTDSFFSPSLNIRGTKLFYEDLNTSRQDVILLVHGHPFDHTMWDYQLDTLKGFRLILPDLKGYGRSINQSVKICIEEQALDLAILLDHLNIRNVHLIGLSMGGQIIVEFSRLFPQRVKSLVICDTNPGGENETTHRNRLALAEEIQIEKNKFFSWIAVSCSNFSIAEFVRPSNYAIINSFPLTSS